MAGEIPTVSKIVMVPDPLNREAKEGGKRLSIASSVMSDSTDNGDVDLSKSIKKTKLQRRRKRLSQLLHTHVVLILVCTLSALDAVCVIGQIVCDILIMKGSLEEWGDLDKNLTSMLWVELPSVFNTSDHSSPDSLNLETIADILLAKQQLGGQQYDLGVLYQQLVDSGIVESSADEPLTRMKTAVAHISGTGMDIDYLRQATANRARHDELGNMVPHSRRKRAAIEKDGELGVLYNLTHVFHLASMIILSALLLECFLKVFAMGKELLHHKLEMFDIFVVTVSWCLDVGFWEGIWAHPESEAAIILIVMLPWRVIRVINSFVLVIQEKDHVELKIVKQRLRLSNRKGKEVMLKTNRYKTEVRQLRSLCKKYGATENEIYTCKPTVCACGREVTGGATRRRRSLKPSLDRSSSVTLLNGMHPPHSPPILESSSDGEDLNPRGLTYNPNPEPGSPPFTMTSCTKCLNEKNQGRCQCGVQLKNDQGHGQGETNPAFITDLDSMGSGTATVNANVACRKDSLTRL